MAQKKKTKKTKEPKIEDVVEEAKEIEKEAEEIAEEAKEIEKEVKPKAYPSKTDLAQAENSFLLRLKDKIFNEEETSYIKLAVSKYIYNTKGKDIRPAAVSQSDFEECMKEAKFKKMVPFLG